MKNIHLLPTEKRSRLQLFKGINEFEFELCSKNSFFNKGAHIYITNNEEIKEGDWYFDGTDLVHKKTKYNDTLVDGNKDAKKIILTTDQDLINDGVQAIDDEFLEWFIKNPNCDFVRTLKVPYFDESSHSYVLIITKEEDICPECGSKGMTLTPKTQCYCGYSPKEEEFELVSMGEETTKLAIPMIQDKEEPKQETLEEVAERLYPTTINSFTDSGFDMSETERLIFINGAKWQQEQNKNLYSEEDLLKFGAFVRIEDKKEKRLFLIQDYYKKWLEQFKKK
jgi:hypothetical protein